MTSIGTKHGRTEKKLRTPESKSYACYIIQVVGDSQNVQIGRPSNISSL